MAHLRDLSAIQYEAHRAMLALAGVRQIVQASVAPGASAEATYTVIDRRTRRVIVCHLGTGAGDIRFDFNATASSADMPIIPQRYFVVDAEKDDVLHFFNTSAGAITVYLMEID